MALPGISGPLLRRRNGADVRIVFHETMDAIPHSLAASGEGTKVLAFFLKAVDHYGNRRRDGVEGTITISDGGDRKLLAEEKGRHEE